MHQNFILYAFGTVRGKMSAVVRIEGVDCFDKTDGADGDQILLIPVSRIVFPDNMCHQTQIVPDQFFPCGKVTGTQCGKGFGFLPGREGPRKAAAFQMKRQNQKLCGKKLQKR